MAKDACENSEKEPNNHEMFSKESTEDQNENRSVVSSMEEGPFESLNMNASLSTNDDPSNTFGATNTGLVQNAKNLHDNDVSVETGATVSSFVDIEKSAKNLLLKSNDNELSSSTSSDNGHKTVSRGYFSENFSKTKNSTQILQDCSNQEEMFNFDCIPNISEEEQSSIKTQINECINTLIDITDKMPNSSYSPIRDIELSSDINKLKPREKLSVDDSDSKGNSSSNPARNLSNRMQNFPKSSEIPFLTNYALRSHSNVILSEGECNLKEKYENSSKDVKEYEDKKVIGKETDKSVSPENITKINNPNSDCHGYKLESMPPKPESIIALIRAYKSEKYSKIVNKFFDSKNSLKLDKTNLRDKTNNENQILEATRQCSKEVTNVHNCLNQIWSHDKDSKKEMEMNELCKNHTAVSKKHFYGGKNGEAIETAILPSKKSCCEEMDHESDAKEQDMSISFEQNSKQLCEGPQESHNEDSVGNPVSCTNIESTNKNSEENFLSKIPTEAQSTLKKFVPSPNSTKNHNLNTKEVRYFEDGPFLNQMSSDTPMMLSNTDETSIYDEVNETDQDNQSDPSVPLWRDRDTDQIKNQYPFEESSFIQQPKELMATEVVKEEPSNTLLMLSNTNKETSICDEANQTDKYTPSDPSMPFWFDRDTDQIKYQYPLQESSFIQQPEELMAAEVVKEEPDGIEIGSFLDQYSGDGDIFDSLRNLNRNVDFTSFDNVFSSDVTYPTFDSLEPTFQIDRFSTPLDSSSSSKEFSETISNSIKEGRNTIQDKKKNSANLRIQILSRKEKPTLGTFYDNSKSFNNLTQSSSPVYGTIKIRTPGNGTTTFQSFSFSPSVDKKVQQYSIQNKAEHTCLGVLRPIKKGVRIEGGEPGIASGTRRVVFAEKTIERENESVFTKYKVVPSVKLIVPKEISQVNTKTENEKSEKENSRIKVYPCTIGTKGKDGTGSVISYFSKAAGLIPTSSNQKLEMDNAQAKSLGPKRNNDARANDGKPSANCSPKLNLLHAVAKELTTESRSETTANITNRKATPLPTTMISSRTRSKRLSLTEDPNTTPSRTSKKMRSSDGEVKTPPIIKISEIVDNYAAKFHNASAALQQRIPKKDFTKKQLLEKVFQSQASVSSECNELLNTEKGKTIADLTLAAVQELNGGQGSTVFDIMSYVRSRVSRNDVNVSQGVRETLKEAAGVGNIQLKSGRYVVTQTLSGKEKAKPKNVKRKSSTIEPPRRTKSLRIFRKPYDENDPCL